MLQDRSPIVVILGHVDHGKTSLLDALLKTSLVASEAGGITQSTRAFQLATSAYGLVTFIDTPGHVAFAAMRARGGRVADVALLVVSGADGVMPQTKESLATVASAEIPMIVVATKSDLPEFNPDLVKTQLAENGVLVEGYGGSVPLVAVSAKVKTGLIELLEMIHLMSQLHPVQADPNAPLAAIVLESRLDAKRGPVAVVIVRDGTLSGGQNLFLGPEPVGKARALIATSGEKVERALPSAPVEIMGLTGVLPVGAIISSQPSDPEPRIQNLIPSSKPQGLKIVLRADVVGSLEAVQGALPVEVNVVLSGTGDVSESDVLLAQSTGSTIVGFNVKVPISVAKLAQVDKVKIVTAGVIYELLEKVDLLARPKEAEKIVGQAQILAEFSIRGLRVAGCKCVEGEIAKSSQIRVGEKLTRIKSLRIGKAEVESVKPPGEFGAVFSPAVDFKVGDIITAFKVQSER